MINAKYKDMGKSTELFCDVCKSFSNMTLLYLYNSLEILTLPVGKYNHKILAVCPICGEIKKVDILYNQLEERKINGSYIIKPSEISKL